MARARKIVAAAFFAMAIAPAASAELVGLRVFQEEPGGSGQPPPGPPRWIYRVYAEFTEPSDMVLSWGTGGTGFGFGGIWNVNASNTPGSGFTNIPNDFTGDTAPLISGTFADWDTYMTIGVLYGTQGPGNMDYTITFPDTILFIANGTSEWTYGAAGLFGNLQQGFADYRVNGNDTDTRVLLMQLVVNAGEHVHGSIGLTWRSLEGEFITTGDLAFNSIPSPSGSLVLMLLGLKSNRKRG